VLFWDIDGTLITTARAGVFAVEQAFREVLDTEPDFSKLFTAGLTDSEVAALAIEAAGHEPTPERVAAMLRAYETHLPSRLPLRQGTVLGGVKEILDDLASRDDVHCLLLTGNTPAGAEAKLTHYGIWHYFEEGAFCTGIEDREAIARRAWELAERRLDGAPDPERVFVIGDTPHDVRCGKAIGARTVAVASGPHPIEALREAEPWLLLEELPEPGEFRGLLGL